MSEARSHLSKKGTRGVVTVNQRDLIDKMLARYASDFVVVRELTQNADDARASSVTINLTRTKGDTFSCLSIHNNGAVFLPEDWHRVARIAEGNPNVDSVGMFGVGFYSVFSLTERPIITSGKKMLGFEWDGPQLATIAADALHPVQGTTTDIPFHKPRHWDLDKLAAFLAQALCFTKTISSLSLTVDGAEVFAVTKEVVPITELKAKEAVFVGASEEETMGSLRTSTVAMSRICIATTSRLGQRDTPQHDLLELVHVRARVAVDVSTDFAARARRILKKDLPSHTTLQLLLPSGLQPGLTSKFLTAIHPLHKGGPAGRVFIGLATHQTTGCAFHVHAQLIPTIERENIDFQDPDLGQWNRALMRMAGLLCRVWYHNSLTGTKRPPADSESEVLQAALLAVAFAPSQPAALVSVLLREGFFLGSGTVMVPVVRCGTPGVSVVKSSAAYLPSLGLDRFIPLPTVPASLVTHGRGMFDELQSRGLIRVLGVSELASALQNAPLPSELELGLLLEWVVQHGSAQLDGAKPTKLLAAASWVTDAGQVKFSKVKYFMEGDRPWHKAVVLPVSVLPHSLSRRFTEDTLSSKLGLRRLPAKVYITHVMADPASVFHTEPSAVGAFALLSLFATELTQSDRSKLKTALSKVSCVPTTLGMRRPTESFLPSRNLKAGTPEVTLRVARAMEDMCVVLDESDEEMEVDEDSSTPTVSRSLLQAIGVKASGIVQDLVRQTSSSREGKDPMVLLRELAGEYQTGNLGPKELEELKKGRLFPAVGRNQTELFRASDLVLPEVASSLPVPCPLPVVACEQLSPNTPAWDMLVRLGCHRFLPMTEAISLCQSHPDDKDLWRVFMEHVELHYARLASTHATSLAYIPCHSPRTAGTTIERVTICCAPAACLSVENPLLPFVVPWLVEMVQAVFPDSEPCAVLSRRFGVREKPPAASVFAYLNDTPPKSVELAAAVFEYLYDTLDVRADTIQRLQSIAFIPCVSGSHGDLEFRRPDQVLITDAGNVADEPARASHRAAPKKRVKGQRKRTRAQPGESDGSDVEMDQPLRPMPQHPLLDKAMQFLIHTVDFSPKANAFLVQVCRVPAGMPPPVQVASLIADKAHTLLAMGVDGHAMYIALLRFLASQAGLSKKELAGLRDRRWLLGYRSRDTAEAVAEGEPLMDVLDRLYEPPELVKPEDCVLIDNPIYEGLVRPLALPLVLHELETLYLNLGSKWLTSALEIEFRARTTGVTSNHVTARVEALIRERAPLLVRDGRGVRYPGVAANAGDALASVRVVEVPAIEMVLRHQGHPSPLAQPHETPPTVGGV